MTESATPAVAFAAKSTEDKHGSIPTQLADARALAERDGLEVMAEFRDEAASAFSGDRGPGLAAALSECERLAAEHGSCALIVQHSDRLARGDGRKAKHLVEYALWAMKAGVTIRSVQDAQTFGDLLYTVVTGQRNHDDSARKSLSVKDGMTRRALRGLANGGPRPFAYTWKLLVDGDEARRKLVVVEPEAAIVRRIFREYVAGKSQRQIVRDLNGEGLRTQRGSQWVQGTVAKLLANPLYRGQVRLNDETYAGHHEPIIDPETWQKAAQLRDATARTKGKGRGRKPTAGHLLQGGLLRCGFCGSAMGATTKPTRTPGRLYEVYECSGRTQYGTDHCPQKPIKRAPIDTAVWEFFANVALDLDATRAAIAQGHDAKGVEIAALRDQAEHEAQRATERLARVRRDYTDGRLDADDWRSFRDDLTGELDAARAQADRLDQQQQTLAADFEQIDVETAVLDELTALRAMVAGEAQAGRREGVDAFRAALRRLFDHFELLVPFESWGHAPEADTIGAPYDRLTVDHGGATLVLYPHVRPEAITGGWDDEARFPALRRAALAVDDLTPSP